MAGRAGLKWREPAGRRFSPLPAGSVRRGFIGTRGDTDAGRLFSVQGGRWPSLACGRVSGCRGGRAGRAGSAQRSGGVVSEPAGEQSRREASRRRCCERRRCVDDVEAWAESAPSPEAPRAAAVPRAPPGAVTSGTAPQREAQRRPAQRSAAERSGAQRSRTRSPDRIEARPRGEPERAARVRIGDPLGGRERRLRREERGE